MYGLYGKDILIVCKSNLEVDFIYQKLSKNFTAKSLGSERSILGLEVDYSQEKGQVVFKQSQFVIKLVFRFN